MEGLPLLREGVAEGCPEICSAVCCSMLSLQVPSGQVGSTWEWSHWIGLEKDINRYRFLIFLFHSWIFEKTSKFWAASCKNEFNLLLVRITVGIESWLPIGWRTYIWWKNLPKCCSILVCIAGCWNSLLTSCNPKNNWCLSRILEHILAEKHLRTCKPWSKK